MVQNGAGRWSRERAVIIEFLCAKHCLVCSKYSAPLLGAFYWFIVLVSY